MTYFYTVHAFLFLYGIIQLLFLYVEIASNSNEYTLGGLLVIPAVIVSVLRMSIGRISLAFMAFVGALIAIAQIVICTFSSDPWVWSWLFDLALFTYVWFLFKPAGRFEKLYSRFGVFSGEKSSVQAEGIAIMNEIEEGKHSINPVKIAISNYCRDYLIEICNLEEQQAALLLLDPELGKEMDGIITKCLVEIMESDLEVEDFFKSKKFDAPQMITINAILMKYSLEFSEREKGIVEYLRSIGYL